MRARYDEASVELTMFKTDSVMAAGNGDVALATICDAMSAANIVAPVLTDGDNSEETETTTETSIKTWDIDATVGMALVFEIVTIVEKSCVLISVR